MVLRNTHFESLVDIAHIQLRIEAIIN